MVIPTLEERLEDLEHLKPALLSELEKERINFADRSNWHLLPQERGGHRDFKASWKYAWSNKIIDYFKTIDIPLSDNFSRGLYNALNKDVMKKVVYGILSLPGIPKEIYESLTDWEKLCFAAGIYSKRGTSDVKDGPLPLIVGKFIKAGIDYLHRTHAVKKAKDIYITLLKIPGSQHYRKGGREDHPIKENTPNYIQRELF